MSSTWKRVGNFLLLIDHHHLIVMTHGGGVPSPLDLLDSTVYSSPCPSLMMLDGKTVVDDAPFVDVATNSNSFI
jgi:hypothetical protein